MARHRPEQLQRIAAHPSAELIERDRAVALRAEQDDLIAITGVRNIGQIDPNVLEM